MFIFDSVLVITVCNMMCYVCVYCNQAQWRANSEPEPDDEALPEDHYSFVALIDIVFTNGEKKTCTGTIIHDNVVITAAHCFNINYKDNVQPEMTTSFVVIGTKKMFDSGYEQYLPIERIVIHPKYKGWTADLALVYTFAGMMSDKPGQVIPMATSRTSTPVDADVMVFSWGKCSNDIKTSLNPEMETTTVFEENAPELESEKFEQDNKNYQKKDTERLRFGLVNNRKDNFSEYMSVTRARGYQSRVSKSKKNDRPLSSIEENNHYNYRQHRYENFTDFNSEMEQKSWEKKLGNLNQMYERSEGNKDRTRQRYRNQMNERVVVNKERLKQRDRPKNRGMISNYRSGWRRKMGDQQNNLTVEIFGFINLLACQRLLHKAVPSLYRIKKSHEILCYASEGRYITEDDAGAPAMRRGRLVAVTVGGASYEDDHVAVGMKMVCFCNWIAENLPQSGTKLQCCKNCCDPNIEESSTTKSSRHSHKKRKL